jgi:hypothetical protein
LFLQRLSSPHTPGAQGYIIAVKPEPRLLIGACQNPEIALTTLPPGHLAPIGQNLHSTEGLVTSSSKYDSAGHIAHLSVVTEKSDL